MIKTAEKNAKVLSFQKWYNEAIGKKQLVEDGEWGPNTKSAYQTVKSAGGYKAFADNVSVKKDVSDKNKQPAGKYMEWGKAYKLIHFYNKYIANNSRGYVFELPAQQYRHTGWATARDTEHANKAITHIQQAGGWRKAKDQWEKKEQQGVAGLGPKKTKAKNKEELSIYGVARAIAAKRYGANAPQLESMHNIIMQIAVEVAGSLYDKQFSSYREKSIYIEDEITSKMQNNDAKLRQIVGE